MKVPDPHRYCLVVRRGAPLRVAACLEALDSSLRLGALRSCHVRRRFAYKHLAACKTNSAQRLGLTHLEENSEDMTIQN